MMEIKNLKLGEVTELEGKLKQMMIENPDIRYRIVDLTAQDVPCPEHEEPQVDIKTRLIHVEDKLDRLINTIKHIFGDAVLFQGKFMTFKADSQLATDFDKRDGSTGSKP